MTQAGVTAAVAHTNLARKSTEVLGAGPYSRLRALAEGCEALPSFRAVPFMEG